MKKVLAIVAAVLVILVVTVSVSVISGYNSLVDSRAQIEADQSQIEIRLQERHDMLLQLIAAVGGLQTHEQAIYDAIVSARGLYDDAVAIRRSRSDDRSRRRGSGSARRFRRLCRRRRQSGPHRRRRVL
ncbi:MAG: LemA family protein [Candidatus Moduliflexus flocculans]|nr:LemA family protein [Candidatus Moduliflexus flocculans]